MNFAKESLIRASPERVFAFHELPDAFQRLTPPGEHVKIIQPASSLRVGERATVELKALGLFKVRWIAQHTSYDPPRMFEDVQVKGPFRSWRHRHLVIPHEEGAILRDEIAFEAPMGIAGRLLAPALIIPRLKTLFAYRHKVTRDWCEGKAD